MNQPTPYPLCWPDHIPRRSLPRDTGAFRTSFGAAVKNVQDSVRLFASDSGRKLEGLVLSSNVSLGAEKPTDPGVAVWFVWDGIQVCIPVDRYSKVEANLQAIHHILEARRVELRHGTLALVRASLKGFIALPAPPVLDWRSVLQITKLSAIGMGDVEEAYKRLAFDAHPDRGGAADRMAELNAARDAARRELKAGDAK